MEDTMRDWSFNLRLCYKEKSLNAVYTVWTELGDFGVTVEGACVHYSALDGC